DDEPWQPPDKLRALRLLGKQPLEAADDPLVARIFLACWLMDPRGSRESAFQEVHREMTGPEISRFKRRIYDRPKHGQVPDDPAAARRLLLEVVDGAMKRLKGLAADHAERAGIEAAGAVDRLAFDESDGGERLRRHQQACGRSFLRSVEVLLKVRR